MAQEKTYAVKFVGKTLRTAIHGGLNRRPANKLVHTLLEVLEDQMSALNAEMELHGRRSTTVEQQKLDVLKTLHESLSN